MGADWRSGKRRGLRTKGSRVRDLSGSPFVVAFSKSQKGSQVRDLSGSPFVVALSKSHLSPAKYWLNQGSCVRTTDLDRL